MLHRVEAGKVEFVRFWFTDILGQLKSFAIEREELPGVSDLAKAFIAGQLRHARELSALFAPSVNSHKRLPPFIGRPSTSRGPGPTARR